MWNILKTSTKLFNFTKKHFTEKNLQCSDNLCTYRVLIVQTLIIIRGILLVSIRIKVSLSEEVTLVSITKLNGKQKKNICHKNLS